MPDDELRLATSVPRDFLEVLGAVSVNFGALEQALELSIWFLLAGPHDIDDRHQIVTAELSFKQLVWLCANLYRERFPGRNADVISSYASRCFEAENKRNSLIHSLWVNGPLEQASAATRLKTTAKKAFNSQQEVHLKQDLVLVANEMTKLTYELQSFVLGEVLGGYDPTKVV